MCARSCLALCNPMDLSLPGSIVHGIFQVGILERVAISSFKASSQPKDQTHVSWVCCIGRWILYHCATWEAERLQITVNSEKASPEKLFTHFSVDLSPAIPWGTDHFFQPPQSMSCVYLTEHKMEILLKTSPQNKRCELYSSLCKASHVRNSVTDPLLWTTKNCLVKTG